jgi:hypothetical protein
MNEALRQGATSYAVRRQLEEHGRAERVGSARRALEQRGEPIVEFTRGTYGLVLPRGCLPVNTTSWSYEPRIRMTPRRHAKEPCHAVAVHPQTAEVVEVCTSPKRHPDEREGSGGARAETAADRKRREEEKLLAAAARSRRKFIRDVLRAKLPKLDVSGLVVQELIRASWQSIARAACELLELDPRPAGRLDPSRVLTEEASRSPARATVVGLALVLASNEERLGPHSSWAEAREYFGLLQQCGYEPSEAERRRLRW